LEQHLILFHSHEHLILFHSHGHHKPRILHLNLLLQHHPHQILMVNFNL
jgi:hypothetical protein